jgi:hypothetical protein
LTSRTLNLKNNDDYGIANILISNANRDINISNSDSTVIFNVSIANGNINSKKEQDLELGKDIAATVIQP